MTGSIRKWVGNRSKMIALAEESWLIMKKIGLINISTTAAGEMDIDAHGHKFMNMVSCDYLGISNLESVRGKVIECLAEGYRVNLPSSSVRVRSRLLSDTESDLEALFDAKCLITLSASEASSALLPLLASGYFHEGKKPVMVFDKGAHFSLKYVAPACSYETEVLEIARDDMDALENVCIQNDRVIYITDSVYSLGGKSQIFKIKELQKKYNLYVCYDEAHSISIFGDSGEGLIRPIYEELPSNTFIIASFSKAFGAAGGAIIMSKDHDKEMIRAIGGPLGWSQSVSDPVLASIKGAAFIHKNGSVKKLQKKLRGILNYFDELVDTPQKGSLAPIRILERASFDEIVQESKKLYENGYYLAPIFFPIVKQGFFGLRLMLRSDVSCEDIDNIVRILKDKEN